MIIISSREK